MTDRELLEAAAKAAGWSGWKSKHGYWNVKSPEGDDFICCNNWFAYNPDSGDKLPISTFADALTEIGWHPLEDDGDALRLAVRLQMTLRCYMGNTCAQIGVSGQPNAYENEVNHDDPCAATRRAIVRAAASIGSNERVQAAVKEG